MRARSMEASSFGMFRYEREGGRGKGRSGGGEREEMGERKGEERMGEKGEEKTRKQRQPYTNFSVDA